MEWGKSYKYLVVEYYNLEDNILVLKALIKLTTLIFSGVLVLKLCFS